MKAIGLSEYGGPEVLRSFERGPRAPGRLGRRGSGLPEQRAHRSQRARRPPPAPAGATLVVTGAAGSVGGHLVELGVAEGLHVVAVAAEEDADLLRSLGARTLVPR